MSADTQLILLIAGMHLLGMLFAVGLLVWFLRSDEEWPHEDGADDSDGGGGTRPPVPGPRAPRPGGLPLPSSVPARVRLRGHEQLAQLHPRPERRPAHAPARTPVRTNVSCGQAPPRTRRRRRAALG